MATQKSKQEAFIALVAGVGGIKFQCRLELFEGQLILPELHQGFAGHASRFHAQGPGRSLFGQHHDVTRTPALACELDAMSPGLVDRAKLVVTRQQQAAPGRLAESVEQLEYRADRSPVPGFHGGQGHAGERLSIGLADAAGRAARP